MNTQFVRKTLLAFVLALSVIFGSGIVTEQTGIVFVPVVYACGSGNGGGC